MTKPTEPVRVVHVTTVDISLRFLLLRQLLDLKNHGYQVAAVCSDGPWVSEIRSLGIPVCTVRMFRAVTPLRDVIALLRLYRFFRRFRPVIVQTHTPKANLLGQLAAWMAGVPIRLKTARGFYLDQSWPGWKRRFYELVEKISTWCAHRVFVQTRADMSMAIREKLCPEEKLHYLGNGIDLEPFHREKHLVAAARLQAELGFPPGAPVVGIVGRLTFEKGYREFMQAAGIIHREQPQVCFLAVGPQDVLSRSDIDRLAKESRVEYSFRFVGLQLDMPKYYAMLSVLVLPSYREGMPRALMEAAAMSLPVVASDIPGCRAAVEAGETGLLVPVRDSEALAQAILEILREPERARTMGVRARQKAEREFDERLVFERMRSLYEQFLECRKLELPK